MKIEKSEVKTSKLLACDPYKEPYSLSKDHPNLKNGQGYELVFENGDTAILASHIPEAHGPRSNDIGIGVGRMYKYQTWTTKAGTLMVEVTQEVLGGGTKPTAKQVADAVPGVTTADKVSPQLREPLRTFEEAANATKKVSKEQLEAEAKGIPHNSIPDNVPRKGVVKLLKHTIETFDKGATTKVKWYVTMEDGAKGIMWSDTPEDQPVKVGQELTYIHDKVYGDGKKITPVPEGSTVDKETTIVRMACVNSAIALVTALPSLITGDGDTGKVTQVLDLAKELEAHVMRSND